MYYVDSTRVDKLTGNTTRALSGPFDTSQEASRFAIGLAKAGQASSAQIMENPADGQWAGTALLSAFISLEAMRDREGAYSNRLGNLCIAIDKTTEALCALRQANIVTEDNNQ